MLLKKRKICQSKENFHLSLSISCCRFVVSSRIFSINQIEILLKVALKCQNPNPPKTKLSPPILKYQPTPVGSRSTNTALGTCIGGGNRRTLTCSNSLKNFTT
jgi:hypothetical protein